MLYSHFVLLKIDLSWVGNNTRSLRFLDAILCVFSHIY